MLTPRLSILSSFASRTHAVNVNLNKRLFSRQFALGSSIARRTFRSQNKVHPLKNLFARHIQLAQLHTNAGFDNLSEQHLAEAGKVLDHVRDATSTIARNFS